MKRMARYLELMDDRRSESRWHLGSPMDEQGQEIDPWQFKDGKTLELGCIPRFPVDVRGRPLDYCWAAFSIPVVHGRVVQLFERLDVREVQFIPARVEGHDAPYFILNALRIIGVSTMPGANGRSTGHPRTNSRSRIVSHRLG